MFSVGSMGERLIMYSWIKAVGSPYRDELVVLQRRQCGWPSELAAIGASAQC
jgi:hypothetical protein